MKVFALGSSGVALVLALLMTPIAPPASASSICERVKADMIESRAIFDSRGIAPGHFADYYDVSHKRITVLGKDYLCGKIKRNLPLFLDERRLLDLDPHKCGLTDNILWVLDREVERAANSDCVQNDPASKILASKILRRN